MTTLQWQIERLLCVPTTETKEVWELIQSIDEYTDYEYYLPDVNDIGMRIRITIVDDQSAYAMLIIDDVDGERYLESFIPNVPYAQACALTNHPR